MLTKRSAAPRDKNGTHILVPRGRAPFGQHQESRPLAKSNTGSPRFTDFPVTLRMFRVKFDKSDWFWSQSIVFTKPYQKRNVVGLGQRSRFLVLTKRSAASGDENVARSDRVPSTCACSIVYVNFRKEHGDKTEVPDPLAVEDLISDKLNNRRKLARLITQYRKIFSKYFGRQGSLKKEDRAFRNIWKIYSCTV